MTVPESSDPTMPVLTDRAAFFPSAGTLVCADLHVGRDAAADVQFPLGERDRLPTRFAALLDRFDPDRVVLAGDLLHAFDRIPDGVEATLSGIERAVSAAGAELLLLRGNHDTMLPSVLDRALEANYDLQQCYWIDEETLVCHGHERPDESATRYVIGHDHPAIRIEGKRRPCYLLGPHRDSDAEVLVLPAFNALAPGVVVNGTVGEDLQSPLVGSLRPFRPAVLDEDAGETLWFPPLEELREFL